MIKLLNKKIQAGYLSYVIDSSLLVASVSCICSVHVRKFIQFFELLWFIFMFFFYYRFTGSVVRCSSGALAVTECCCAAANKLQGDMKAENRWRLTALYLQNEDFSSYMEWGRERTNVFWLKMQPLLNWSQDRENLNLLPITVNVVFPFTKSKTLRSGINIFF